MRDKMMKTFIKIIGVAMTIGMLSGCSTYLPQGLIYTQVTGSPENKGIRIDPNDTDIKTGKSCATSVLGIVATGDISTQAAAQQMDITEIKSVTYTVNNILGVIGTYCTIVKGN